MKVWIVVCSNYHRGDEKSHLANAKCFASIGAAKEYIRLDKDCYDDYDIFESEMKY